MTTPEEQALLATITSGPEVCHGKPCVRGMRFPVADVLGYLTVMTPEEVLADFPCLTPDDLRACLLYAQDAVVSLREWATDPEEDAPATPEWALTLPGAEPHPQSSGRAYARIPLPNDCAETEWSMRWLIVGAGGVGVYEDVPTPPGEGRPLVTLTGPLARGEFRALLRALRVTGATS